MSRRSATEIAREFDQLADAPNGEHQRRRWRSLMAEAGHNLTADSAWREFAADADHYRVDARPFDDPSDEPCSQPLSDEGPLLKMKQSQEAFELGQLKFSNLRSPVDFLAAHHFLEFIITDTKWRPLSKWGPQIPDLKRWKLTKDDGTTIELQSDVHPGKDTLFDDFIMLLSRIASEALGRIETQEKWLVQRHAAMKEARVNAVVQHIDAKLAEKPGDVQRVELEGSREAAVHQLRMIEQAKELETREWHDQQRIRAESALIIAAAVPLENLVWDGLHLESITLPEKIHHAVSRVVHDPEGELLAMSPEDASKAITAIRVIRDHEQRGPLPIALPDFRAIHKTAKPWFVIEHIENDFMLFHYTMAALIKIRQRCQFEPGTHWVLDARTRALIKHCLETPTLPDSAKQHLGDIYVRSQPASLDQITTGISQLDIASMMIRLRPTRISGISVALRESDEVIELSHGSSTDLPTQAGAAKQSVHSRKPVNDKAGPEQRGGQDQLRTRSDDTCTSQFQMHIVGGDVDFTFGEERKTFSAHVGFNHIAWLLRTPGQELDPIKLRHLSSDAEIGTTDSKEAFGLELRNNALASGRGSGIPVGEIVDEKTLTQCQERVEEIDEKIKELKSNDDIASTEELCKEKHELEKYVAGAVRRGGMPRINSTERQNAQRNAKRAIDRALKKIKPKMPKLFEHFSRNLRSGPEFSYSSDLQWVVNIT